MIPALYAGIALLVGGALLWNGVRGRLAVGASLFCLLLLALPAAFLESTGTPKPYGMEWRALDEARVLSVSLDEPRAIYVWAKLESDPQPRAYVLPWSTKTADRAQKMMAQAQTSGNNVMLRVRAGDGSDSTEDAMFHPEPRRASPPKTVASR